MDVIALKKRRVKKMGLLDIFKKKKKEEPKKKEDEE